MGKFIDALRKMVGEGPIEEEEQPTQDGDPVEEETPVEEEVPEVTVEELRSAVEALDKYVKSFNERLETYEVVLERLAQSEVEKVKSVLEGQESWLSKLYVASGQNAERKGTEPPVTPAVTEGNSPIFEAIVNQQ